MSEFKTTEQLGISPPVGGGRVAELLARVRALLGEPARRRRLARLRAGELPWRRSWRTPWRNSKFSRPHWKPVPTRWWPTPPLDPGEEAAWREVAGDHQAAAIERAAREIDDEVTRAIIAREICDEVTREIAECGATGGRRVGHD